MKLGFNSKSVFCQNLCQHTMSLYLRLSAVALICISLLLRKSLKLLDSKLQGRLTNSFQVLFKCCHTSKAELWILTNSREICQHRWPPSYITGNNKGKADTAPAKETCASFISVFRSPTVLVEHCQNNEQERKSIIKVIFFSLLG